MISAQVRLMRLLVTTGFLLVAMHSVQAQPVFYDWTGAADTNYLNAANWNVRTTVGTGVTVVTTVTPATVAPGANAHICMTGDSAAFPNDTRTINLNYTGTGTLIQQVWGMQTGLRSAYTLNLSGTNNGWLNYNIVGRGATPYHPNLVFLQTVANIGSTSTRLPFAINLGSYSRIVFDGSTSVVGGSTSGLNGANINMTGNAEIDVSQAGTIAYTYAGVTTTPKNQVELGSLNMTEGTTIKLGMKGIASIQGQQAAGVTSIWAGRIYADADNVQVFQKWGNGVTRMTGVMDLGKGGFNLRTGTYLVDGVHNGQIGTNIASGSSAKLGGTGTINYMPAAVPVNIGTVDVPNMVNTYVPAVNMGIRSFLAPGGVVSGGTLTVNGNVVLNGALSIMLYDVSDYGRLVINGNLWLGNGTANTSSLAVGVSSTFPLVPGTFRVLEVNPNSSLAGISTGNIYNGVGAVAGAPTTVGAVFNSVSLPISQGLKSSWVFGSNYVDIIFTQMAFAENPLLTGNHLIIANHIDNAVIAGKFPLQMLDTLNRQPSIILFRNMLDQLSPAAYYGWYPAAVVRSHAMNQTVQDRFDQSKKRTNGSLDTYLLTSRQESSVAATSIADYTNFDTTSIIGGAEYTVSSQLTLGGLVDYSGTNFDLDTWGSNGKCDSYTGALYGQYVQGNTRLQLLGFLGADDYTSSRVVGLTLLGDMARSKTKGSRAGTTLSASHTIDFSWIEVTPNVNFDVFYWTAKAFQETDAGAVALSVNEQKELLFAGRAGLRFAKSFSVANGVIRPFINVGLQHQFNNGVRTIKAELFGTQTSVRTNGLEANGLRYDAGFDWDMSKSSSLQIRYSSENGGVVDESMAVRAGLTVAF